MREFLLGVFELGVDPFVDAGYPADQGSGRSLGEGEKPAQNVDADGADAEGDRPAETVRRVKPEPADADGYPPLGYRPGHLNPGCRLQPVGDVLDDDLDTGGALIDDRLHAHRDRVGDLASLVRGRDQHGEINVVDEEPARAD